MYCFFKVFGQVGEQAKLARAGFEQKNPTLIEQKYDHEPAEASMLFSLPSAMLRVA